MTILLKQKKVKLWRAPIGGLLAAGFFMASGPSYALDVVKSLSIPDPSTTDPANVAPGDLLSYTVTITDDLIDGVPITNIDLTDALTAPAGTSLVAGSVNIAGAREVRIYRDNVDPGDDFDDGGTSGDDGNVNFTSNWDEVDGGGGGGETDGADSGDEQIVTNSGREVIRFRDDQGQGNGRGEGVARQLDLATCVDARLQFDMAGQGLGAGQSVWVEESNTSLTGTTWTPLVEFVFGTGNGTTGATRDIANNTYVTQEIDLLTGAITAQSNYFLRFIADDANDGNDGAYVDNIQVTALCGVVTDITGVSLADLMDSGDLDGSSEYTNGEAIYGLQDGESITVTYDVLVSDGASIGSITNDLDADIFDAYTGTGPTNAGDSITTSLAYFDDAGDAPDGTVVSGSGDYTTLLTNGGPRHRVVAGVQLGSVAPDIDSGGFEEGTDSGGNATDDDAAGDEGEAQLLDDSVHPTDIFPSFTEGDSSYSLTIDYDSTGAGTLYGWIDFDSDGLFEESERATAAVTGAGTEAALNWSGISGASAGTTYARFRISTDNLDSAAEPDGVDDDAALGFATDGEVEDYQFTVIGPPVCYAAYSDGSINSTVFSLLGLTPAATGTQADFDVVTNNNDGDNENYGMIFTTTLIVPSTGNYEFRLNSDDGSQLYIDGKLVVDYDGNHGANGPVITSGVPLTAGNHDLQVIYYENGGLNSLTVQWDGSGSIANISSAELLAPASCPTNPGIPLDYGDADAAYDDASHIVSFDDDYSLGSLTADTEAAAQPSVGADADDSAGTDDEDADPDLTGLDNTYTGNYVVSVPVTNAGADATLGGWIDFDGDDVFETAEYASATVTSSDTSVDLTFDTNAVTVTAGTTYARFRISRDTFTNADASGRLAGGEVEDYSLNIADLTQVYFESECGVIGSEWTANLDTNASENVFVQTVNDRTSTLTGAQPDADMIVYQIPVPIPGTYDIYARISVDGGESFHLSYDNATWWAHDLPGTGNVFQWVDLEPNIQNGTYQEIVTTVPNEVVTIYMAYREADALVDKFAILTDDSAVPTGLGDTVGTCFDFGDANDSSAGNGVNDYSTEFDNSGAVHLVDGEANRIRLGSADPDTEADALDNLDATGDDVSDEGAAQLLSTAQGDLFPVLLPTDTSYSFEIDLTNSVDSVANTDATLFAWVDFDNDGLFEESELADSAPFTIPYNAASQTQSISWTGLSGLTQGTTTARFRITTDTGLVAGGDGGEDEASLDLVFNGEVEDHLIFIGGDDYGDAPADYGDANHAIAITPTLYLGPAAPDSEALSQQGGDAGAGADGDDGDGNDDESSLTSIPILNTSQIGQTYSLSVNVVNTTDDASADLFGWIDFNQDASFAASEGVTLNTPTSGLYQLDWTVPGDAVAGDTYIRLRVTSDASVLVSTSTGSATDGEVEDYALVVTQPLDYGDAIDSGLGVGPLNYRTELAEDGARHLLSAGLFLGDTASDVDADALDNGVANGDDNDGVADEGVEQLLSTAQGNDFPALSVADEIFSFEIDLTNITGGNANLYTWLDFDQSGTFDEDELGEGTAIPISDSQTTVIVNLGPTDDTLIGNTYMRVRLTTDTLTPGAAGGEDERSFGLANDGEVEDYRIEITGLDFGDAPDTYATDKTDGGEGVGPSHVQNGNLYIGDTLPDLDSDGVPSTSASGDDADGDDEGGYFVPVIGSSDTSYSITLPVVNNTGSAATLFGWLDLNEDGDFDTNESVSVAVASGSLSATLSGGNWASFSTLSGSQTYLRLRLTTDASITTATPGGSASDGEVEDHQVIVGVVDFGDAPDSYSTDLTVGNDGVTGFDQVGPTHGIDANLFIGLVAPDGEVDGQPSATATDDESNGTADELPFSFPLLTPATETYSLTVDLTNTTGADAELVGWIDFDANGFFDNDEGATVTVANTDSSADLVWSSIPGDIVVADTFMRLRLTSDLSIATQDATTSLPINAAFNGEVEDHAISIVIAYDYGDAPDTYGTDGTDGGEGFGPRHIISPNLYLGPIVPDAESDGQPSADALLDDDTGTGEATIGDSTDGDEGDLFLTTIQPDQTSYTLSVPLNNATGASATLYGWLDLNQDGDFLDTNESQTTTILPGSSFGTLVFTWASGDTSGGNGMDNGTTFLRLRLSSDTGLGPTAALAADVASDGEVEDYRVQVSLLTCDLIYGSYAGGGYVNLREFDNDTVNLATADFQTTGIGIDRIYRRLYYMEWVDSEDDGVNELNYFDPTATPSTDVDTGAQLPEGADDNYNRMAFSFDGRGVMVESSVYDVHLFDPTPSGTGQTLTNAITMTNEASILGGGGDIAFDRDDNLYMVTYTTGAGSFYYLYEIRFFLAGTSTEVAIGDLVLTGSPETTYEAQAILLLTEDNTSGESIAGMAFNFDNLIYLQGSNGGTRTWDVGITSTGGTGAINELPGGNGSGDLASCIYPYIRAIIEPVKTVVNQTSGGSGYVPGDTLEYTIVVRNAGGFPSFDTIFQDDIQPGTTYVPNSTTMNGDVLTDTGGLMPFVVGREIHTDGAADGTVLADITPGVVGDNEVVITYQVLVDADGSNTTICNQGFVDYEANIGPLVPTNDPGTGAADDPTCLTQTSGFKVSGTLYEDLNVDALLSASEPGISGVTMVLYDSVAGSCVSTATDANGFYEFGSVSGGPKTVYEVSGAAIPVPATCPPAALGNDPSGYLSSTSNTASIYVINANITDLDFGDVRVPSLNPDLEGVVVPGGIQTYSHLFRAPTNGSVTFSEVSTDSPLLAGWTSLIYEDVDCSGGLSTGDYPILSAINLVAGESICLVNRVFAPTSAVAGNTLLTDLTATFNYAGALVTDQDVEAQDLTTVLDSGESALQLTKRVRNITDSSTEFDAEAAISNAAKPGDRLRYEITFANTGVGNISDIDIYDVVPAFTELAEVLDTSCNYTGPVTSPLSAVVPPTIMTSCTLITPAGGANAVGYSGPIHWQLTGTLQPGESGLIVFTVDVD